MRQWASGEPGRDPARRRAGSRGLRITGGALAGRRLRVPAGSTRPTSDRVREALFARLDVEGARVLDLYAGSGALGCEALSRGAEGAVFVERSPRGLAVLRANLEALDLLHRAAIRSGDAVGAVRRLAGEGRRFDLALLDPPYASGEAQRALQALRDARILVPGGLVVIESGRRHPVPVVEGYRMRDQRRYGDTLVSRLDVEPAGGQGRE